MNYQEAKRIFVPERFPFGYRYKEEQFHSYEIELRHFAESRVVFEKIVDEYVEKIENGIEILPVWGSVGRKMRNGKIQIFWNNMIQIKDGNHRTAAFRKKGLKTIKTIMPESHYFSYINEYRR